MTTANQVEIAGWQTQLTTETRDWNIELAAELDPGDVPASASSTLTDLLTGAGYPAGLVGIPTIVGTVVTQVVYFLQPGHRYRLVITVSVGGSRETATAFLIWCPY